MIPQIGENNLQSTLMKFFFQFVKKNKSVGFLH